MIETAIMMEERRYIVISASFAASMSILTGMNIATAGEFGTHIL